MGSQFPNQGSNPCPPQQECRGLTTGSPGNPPTAFFVDHPIQPDMLPLFRAFSLAVASVSDNLAPDINRQTPSSSSFCSNVNFQHLPCSHNCRLQLTRLQPFQLLLAFPFFIALINVQHTIQLTYCLLFHLLRK